MKKVVFILYAWLVFPAVSTGQPSNLIERIESELKKDQAFSAPERAGYLKEFRRQLGAYAFDPMGKNRTQAVEVIMRLVLEGSLDKTLTKQTVSLAAAAYMAIRRGAPADFVEGIALYGFRKKLDADTIAAWANGVNDCIKLGVPEKVVKALVHQAAEGDLDVAAFNILKWGLIQAVKPGYDLEKFAGYLFGQAGNLKKNPGKSVADTLRAFRIASRAGTTPEIPAFDSPLFVEPFTKPEQEKPTTRPNGPAKTALQPRVVFIAKLDKLIASYIGSPYVWGGRSRKGADCSGFVQAVFAEMGIALPRNSEDMWRLGGKVSYQELQKGDLVFFKTTSNRISHVGIVTDPNKKLFAHASSKRGVTVTSLESKYYKRRFAGARRLQLGL